MSPTPIWRVTLYAERLRKRSTYSPNIKAVYIVPALYPTEAEAKARRQFEFDNITPAPAKFRLLPECEVKAANSAHGAFKVSQGDAGYTEIEDFKAREIPLIVDELQATDLGARFARMLALLGKRILIAPGASGKSLLNELGKTVISRPIEKAPYDTPHQESRDQRPWPRPRTAKGIKA